MKTIIFDYDGVIADSFDVYFDVFKRVTAKNNGLATDEASFRKLFEDNFYESLKKNGLSRKSIMKDVLLFEHDAKDRVSDIPVFKGMSELIGTLSKENRIFVVTSNLAKVVKRHLEMNNITGITEVYGAETHYSKVEKIRNIISEYDDNIYFVSDTSGDIKEGNSLGVKTIAITWGYHKEATLKKAEPDFIIDTPEELLGLLQ